MIEGITLFIVGLAIYAALLAAQKIRQKSSWGNILKNGDPWFVIHLPISMGVAIPVARRIANFFM